MGDITPKLMAGARALPVATERRTSMRRAAKTDRNQEEIVRAFRQVGASVQILSAVGKGCPDILVGWRGKNCLVEIKDGTKHPSARRLTADQENWHARWGGQVFVAESIEDAVTQVARAVVQTKE